jgi:hypothetical protein
MDDLHSEVMNFVVTLEVKTQQEEPAFEAYQVLLCKIVLWLGLLIIVCV